MDSLNSLAVFVKVAESRSFANTGRVIGISSSAVGKCISRLEEKLEVRLFHRSTRNVCLTAEGELFLSRCRYILAELETARTELREIKSSPKGKLKISMPLVSSLFLPVFNKFTKTWPDIVLELDFSDKVVDVIQEGFDAVIRTGKPKDSGLSARTVGRFRTMLVATPDYLLCHDEPRTPEDLKFHKCILYRHSDSGKLQCWPLKGTNEGVESYIANMFICNNTESRLYFTLQSNGIALLPDFLIVDELNNGRLKHVLPGIVEQDAFFYVLWPGSDYLSPKLRTFIDFLCEHFPCR